MPIRITVPFEQLADDIEQELDRKYRAFWFTLWNGVNLRSPVDTGRYRSSHCMVQGQPGYSTVGTGFVSPPNGLPTMSIYTALPYSEVLENGHSGQAPGGIYALALQSAITS